MWRPFVVLFFAFTTGLFGQEFLRSAEEQQELPPSTLDSLPKIDLFKTTVSDTLPEIEEIFSKEKDSLQWAVKDSLPPKKIKKKKIRPPVKPLELVTVEDYKILYMDDSESYVDTTLTIQSEYEFNFLREDYFELLPLPNMGEGFNRMGYDFHSTPFTPQLGARVKHFGYYEREDVAYYNVPTPYTELFFKTTFEKGQHLNSLITINTSPRFNVSIGFRGFRSQGKYAYALSRTQQFRSSIQYGSYDKRYRLRVHVASQKLENEQNGGLTNDSVYFFENAPNYVVADESGEPVLDENGNEQYQFYDGFLDRSRLSTQIRGDSELKGKRAFVDQRYNFIPTLKDTLAYQLSLGHQFTIEEKSYNYYQSVINNYFEETHPVDGIDDLTKINLLENKVYLNYSTPSLGQFKASLNLQSWKYALGEKEYTLEENTATGIDVNQLALEMDWSKSLFGIQTEAHLYKSLMKDFASTIYEVKAKRNVWKDIYAEGQYQFRSQPLNFNFYLYRSDYVNYNWYNPDFKNQLFSTLAFRIGHPKWGVLSAEKTAIDNYGYFRNVTTLKNLNKRFLIDPRQSLTQIEYLKLRFNQRLDFGKFSWVNAVQFQEVNQPLVDPEATLNAEPIILNVPKWLIRSSLFVSSYLFNKALYMQTGATFNFFTDYYADQYNPLIAEFITQNNTKIGEYPRVDFFFNAKVQQARLFVKLENLSAPIEHLIFPETPYDYYAAPFVPYRDFSLRIGLIWDFFD